MKRKQIITKSTLTYNRRFQAWFHTGWVRGSNPPFTLKYTKKYTNVFVGI